MDDLTQREAEILSMLADGLTDVAIGRRLFIARSTVKFHVSSIYAKFGLFDNTKNKRVLAARVYLEASYVQDPVGAGR